ncbi:hypothetical protein CGI42_20785 [Vibrio parahaemolyticus]|nr:hypothetical protein CGI42_20785 [Vibrio parahaemolyticus]
MKKRNIVSEAIYRLLTKINIDSQAQSMYNYIHLLVGSACTLTGWKSRFIEPGFISYRLSVMANSIDYQIQS